MSVRAVDGLGNEPGTRRAVPFLAWPGFSHIRYSLALAAANGAWFVLVYAGCDYLTGQRALRVQIHFASELAIPFVAWMTAVYVSLYVLMIGGPFVLRTREELRAVIAALAVVIGVAGIGFLLLPAEIAFPPVQPGELGVWAPLFRFSDALNLTYNLLPSLHVALAVVCVAAFSTKVRGIGRALLWAWAGAIALSTLLTHQHHVLDVVTGWGLALVAFKYVYIPLARERGNP